eukprot:sb/3476650/
MVTNKLDQKHMISHREHHAPKLSHHQLFTPAMITHDHTLQIMITPRITPCTTGIISAGKLMLLLRSIPMATRQVRGSWNERDDFNRGFGGLHTTFIGMISGDKKVDKRVVTLFRV